MQKARTPLSRGAIDALCEFDTALLANALDYLDGLPQHERYLSGDIQSVTPTLGPTAGVAVTCRIDTSTPNEPADVELLWKQLEEIGAMNVPTVWIAEAVGSRPDHECIAGDGMAKLFRSVGCVGMVTNGRVRDIHGLVKVSFATYCRGMCAHHCALRIRKINVPVNIGGIVIRPGDVIHADNEGVITLRDIDVAPLLQAAPKLVLAEREVHKVWRREDISMADKRRHAAEVYSQHDFTM